MSTNAPTTGPTTSLSDVERMVGVWCDQTDPALCSGADAAVAVERLAKVMRRLQAKQASFATRVDECHSHSKRFASSDDYLARVNGTSRGEAKKAIETARRLKRCPVAKEAFDQGDLSLGEADAISGAAALDPSAEAGLVARATDTHDLSEVRERAAKVKEAARKGEDPAVRRARLRAMRCWREFDRDGMREVMARFVKEDWALVAPVVQAYLDAVFDQARRDGRRDPIEAYRADAVLAALAAAGEAVGLAPARATMLRAEPAAATETAATEAESTDAESTDATETAATEAGSTEPTDTPETAAAEAESADTTVPSRLQADAELAALLRVRPDRVKWNLVLLVDAIALQRGYATANETCEVVGLGPISVDLASEVLPEALVDVLVHDLVDIRAHATMTRHQKKALKAALKARDRRCVVPGCKRRRRLQADHRHDFAKQGPTAYQNMELLCEVHHHEKTHRGARISNASTTSGTGTRHPRPRANPNPHPAASRGGPRSAST